MIDIRGRMRTVNLRLLEDPSNGLFLGIQATNGMCNAIYARTFEPESVPWNFHWKTTGIVVKQFEFTLPGQPRYEPKNASDGYYHNFYAGEPHPPSIVELEIFVHTLPILLLLGSCTFVLLVPSLFRLIRRSHRRRNGRCLDCGYSVLGNVSGVCPECGTAISPLKTKEE